MQLRVTISPLSDYREGTGDVEGDNFPTPLSPLNKLSVTFNLSASFYLWTYVFIHTHSWEPLKQDRNSLCGDRQNVWLLSMTLIAILMPWLVYFFFVVPNILEPSWRLTFPLLFSKGRKEGNVFFGGLPSLSGSIPQLFQESPKSPSTLGIPLSLLHAGCEWRPSVSYSRL